MAAPGKLAWVTRGVLGPLWSDTRVTADEIGRRLGVTGSAVCYRARALGLPPRQARGVSGAVRARDAEFRRLWLAGVKLGDIAAHFGMTKGYAQAKRRHLGLPPRTPRAGAGGYGGFGGIGMAQLREAELAQAMADEARRRA